MSEFEGTTVEHVSSGGRSLGRNDITVGHADVTVPFHRTDGTPPLFAGFRINWFDGADEETGTTFDLSAGAGVGSPYLTLTVEVPGHETVYEYVDMAAVLEQRIMAIIAEVTAPAPAPAETVAEAFARRRTLSPEEYDQIRPDEVDE